MLSLQRRKPKILPLNMIQLLRQRWRTQLPSLTKPKPLPFHMTWQVLR
jgi:hypothetical protein